MSKLHNPPKLALRFLRWFCSPERLEELEGDLFEMYNAEIEDSSEKMATLLYYLWVIRSFRPFALKRKRNKNSKFYQIMHMELKHNFKVSVRGILKHRQSSFINVFGLILGIVSFISIIRMVQYELSYNSDVVDSDQVYRISTRFVGAFEGSNPGVCQMLPQFMEENSKDIEFISPVYTWSPFHKKDAQNSLRDIKSAFVKPDYFKIINQYNWIAGDLALLDAPGKVILEEKQARKYFDHIPFEDIMGKTVIYNDSIQVEVVGIIQMPTKPTDLSYTDFISFASLETSGFKNIFGEKSWSSVNSNNQLWIKTNVSEEARDKILHAANEKVKKEQEENVFKTEFELQSLEDLHFSGYYSIATKKTLAILSLIALSILGIAIFNFINLAVAQGSLKMKEVGIRKTLGSHKGGLVARFLTESYLLTFVAGILAIPLMYYVFQLFSSELPTGITPGFNDPVFVLQYIFVLAIIALLAGAYPAFVVSSFPTMNALKNSISFSNKQRSGSLLRKLLISFQFIFSQLLILFTIVIYLQMDFLLTKEMGFQKENILYFRLPGASDTKDAQLIKNQLLNLSEIEDAVIQSNPPAFSGWSTMILQYKDDKTDQVIDLDIHSKNGEENYIDFYGLKLLAGRKYHRGDSLKEILVTSSLRKELGIESPEELVGKKLGEHTIVGVLEDFHVQSLHYDIEPVLIELNDEYSKSISFKTNGNNLKSAINKVSEILETTFPQSTVTINFLDETVEEFYKSEKKTSKIASVATILAIFISCLGLYGMISQIIVRKTKEVGIRKVMGASISQLGIVLSKEFILIIFISILISLPIAIFLVDQWISDYSYRVELGIWVYFVSGAFTFMIAAVSVIFKVIKASRANPVASLKYE